MSSERPLPPSLSHLRTSTAEPDRVAYARDLWPRHHLSVRAGQVANHRPGRIVWPASTAEVAEIVRYARDTGTPIVPFGAGSGVCAGVLPTRDAIVLDLKRLDRIRHIEAEGPWVDVEAGHMGVPFEEKLERQGFTLGHFPSSILCSTVGGWIAARSAGQCSGRYGKIEDMVLSLECVTGEGELLEASARTSGPSLVPLLVGSEGTLAVITAAKLRLQPKPRVRAFAAYHFASTEKGWDGMRRMFQAGLRPAVARLYDPFDAMLARQGSVKRAKSKGEVAPGLGGGALRTLLKSPGIFNGIIDGLGTHLLGPAQLVLVFEGDDVEAAEGAAEARRMLEAEGAEYVGEGPAQKWFLHRYSVSYRQAPVFAAGLFSDTIEVATTWEKLGDLYDGVRKALGRHVFVMAHLSHAYPDGCCIYFSFAGSAQGRHAAKDAGWDAACEATYDAAWRAALRAADEAGGTIAHHHGVGRSKAPRLREEIAGGVEAFAALKRAFDPAGILNPGALVPEPKPDPYAMTLASAKAEGGAS
ncbi:MAG: FAD-binding oxidoreductase [Polyangiaceae bacterium]|nr:FAD-binding oxidoreductase [Polyangiaceae bacterium]